MDASQVGVIILTHGNYSYSIDCLKKIHTQFDKPRRIVLCDNGSGNNVADLILNAWQEIAKENNLEKPVEVFAGDHSGAQLVLLRSEENLGVGGGINLALSFLLFDKNCEAFWILHNDTLPENYALSALINHVNEDESENIGLVGSTLLFADSELQECAGGGIFSKFSGKGKLIDKGYDKYAHTDQKKVREKLDYINGASCLVTRKLIESIGFYDDRFCFFFEDVDYGLRAKKAGFKLNWAPGSIVKHISPHAETFTPILNLVEAPKLTTLISYFYIRNRFYLLRRENPLGLFTAFISLFFSCLFRKKDKIKGIFSFKFGAALDGVRKKMEKKLLSD